MTRRTFLACFAISLFLAISPAFATEPAQPSPSGTTYTAADATRLERINHALDLSRRRYLSTDQHSPWQIFHGILAFGQEFQLRRASSQDFVNAIEFELNEAQIGGRRLFTPTAYGLEPIGGLSMEGHPDQFLAKMALSGVALDRPIVYGDRKYTIADLVRQAQHDYYSGQEASWTLISFATYLPLDATWQNPYGRFRIDDLVKSEVGVHTPSGACGGTHNLFALAYALERYRDQGRTPSGVWVEAAEKLERYRRMTQSYQNRDGLFSTDYYLSPSWSGDPVTQLETSGHTLEWLAVALSDDQFNEPWISAAVDGLLGAFERTSRQPIDCGALYHGAHGLMLYRQRKYGDPARLDVLAEKSEAPDNAASVGAESESGSPEAGAVGQ
jgi:hypothetical protein